MKIYRDGTEIYDLEIDGNTYLSQKLMSEDLIYVVVVMPEKLTITIGDYIIYNDVTYTINRPVTETKVSPVEYDYTLQFESPFYDLLDKVFMIDGKSTFYLTGYLSDFIGYLVSNINEIHSGWSVGEVDDSEWLNLSFTGKNCKETLDQIASKFDVEYSVVNKTISAVERVNNSTDLTFEYGKGKGLYSLERQNVDDENTVTRVYGYGSTRNIPYTYRDGADNLIFENEDGTHYLENLTSFNKVIEKSVVFENIYPKFEGAVGVVADDKLSFVCSEIDFDVNDYLLYGSTAKIVFIDGDLMGSEFEVSYDNNTKTVSMVQTTSTSGLVLPSEDTFYPATGDSFVFIDISMPDSYVTAAETKLKAATQEYLDYYSQLRVAYTLTIDPRYIRDNDITLKIGDLITIVDTDLSLDTQIRVTSLNKKLDNSGITVEVSNFLAEKFEAQVTSQLNDALSDIASVSDTVNTQIIITSETVESLKLTWLKSEITFVDNYLLYLGEKINAGDSDKLGGLLPSSYTKKTDFNEGIKKDLASKTVSVTFNNPFSETDTIIPYIDVYRYRAYNGHYIKENVLHYFSSADWYNYQGFSLTIDESESLTGVIVQYRFTKQ